MSDRLDQLKAKLAARKGRGGFRGNVAEIEAEIARLEAEPEPEPSLPPIAIPGRYRSAITGKFVSPEYAAANPATTYRSDG